MPKYDFPVPQSRGLQNTVCDVVADSGEKACVRDVFLNICFGRAAITDERNQEITAHFNPRLNAIEMDIDDDVMSMIESINIGPNFQRYLAWIYGGMTSGGSSVKTISSGTYTVLATDEVLLVNTTSTVTLLAAASATKRLDIKNIGTGTVTIETNGSEEIDGDPNLLSTNPLDVQYQSVTLISDGSNWQVL